MFNTCDIHLIATDKQMSYKHCVTDSNEHCVTVNYDVTAEESEKSVTL